MNNRFDDTAKEQVRMRADIASVIGRYVNLKGRGATMTGLCPFHKEKTPSFTVNPARGLYHCFGCGKGGDVFSFVQEMEGVDFREALEMLAEDTGVRLENRRAAGREPPPGAEPPPGSPPAAGAPPARASKTELLAIHDEAAKFFYSRVKGNSTAVDYFKSRGLSAETVREFRLGYAPDAWSELCDYLRGKGVPVQKIIECGLAVSKEGGAVYDRFRDRIIFPLCDLSGRVIAFAGRGLDGDTQPKYLNSPETALYRKSGVLYGMHSSRRAVREEGRLLIVEGYMDYLTLWQAGVRNAAAVSGTAFTQDHAHIIKRFASKVTLVFDGDRAGLAAAQRAAFVLAPFNLEVSILTLPEGDDPDTFVGRSGAAAFSELLSSSSQPAADFLIDKLAAEHGDTPHGKSRAVGELAPYARALSDGIVRDDFLTRLARRLRVDRRLVADRVSRSGSRPSNEDSQFPGAPAAQSDAGGRGAPGALEESFFRILLTSPELITSARQYVSPDFFTDTLSADIYSVILEAYVQDGDLGGLYDLCSGDREVGRAVSALAVKPTRTEGIEDELVQKILLLRRKFFKARIVNLKEELRACPETDKGALLEELKKCGEQLKEIENN